MDKNKKFKFTKKNIIIVIIVVIALIAIAIFGYFKSSLGAASSKKNVVYYEIKEGATLDSIVNELEDNDYIKNASITKIVAKMNGDSEFAIGTYAIDTHWDSDKIMNYLADKNNIVIDQVKLTFREGIWAKDIAKLIGENTNVKSDELLTLWNDDEFLKKCIDKYDFLTNDILNSQYRVKLEGYLFPETYYFNKKTTAEEITYTFLDQFNNEYENIKSKIKKQDLSIHELVTLASVVQYESATKEDMGMIAGVFYNRLAINQKLQSSVTVCYAIYDYDNWEDCETQTDIDSPYNTYEHEGLPIGPILNPGKQAIEAVLDPTKNDYYYFVADVHGDGKVYYSKTYEEHQAKVQKYLGY